MKVDPFKGEERSTYAALNPQFYVGQLSVNNSITDNINSI